jgi:hypothetical protein
VGTPCSAFRLGAAACGVNALDFESVPADTSPYKSAERLGCLPPVPAVLGAGVAAVRCSRSRERISGRSTARPGRGG